MFKFLLSSFLDRARYSRDSPLPTDAVQDRSYLKSYVVSARHVASVGR